MFKTEFENVRRTCPLIHNITNYVTVNDCANMVLACGASPIMADDAAEVEEITAICGGPVWLQGTLFLLVSAVSLIATRPLVEKMMKKDRTATNADRVIGHITGGLGHANILASIIFSGMSGTAIADAGGLGAIELKAMKDAGYDEDFSLAITGASSIIGPINWSIILR